jgi:hypothetical protein
VYTQAWLGTYLRHEPGARQALTATSWTYLEPTGSGAWTPIRLHRDELLSRYFCSGVDLRRGGRAVDPDLSGVGCVLGAPVRP